MCLELWEPASQAVVTGGRMWENWMSDFWAFIFLSKLQLRWLFFIPYKIFFEKGFIVKCF